MVPLSPLPVTPSGYVFDDLTSDHTIDVTFKPIPSYTITVTAQNGTVDTSPVTVYRGDSYTTTATPDTSCFLHPAWWMEKSILSKRGEGNITLTAIQSDHTIELIYSRVDWMLVLCFPSCF